MGTDIHIMLQSKMDDEWVTHGQLSNFRSYLIFGVLAGVRGCHLHAGPIAEPRGFPEGFTWTDGPYAEARSHEGIDMGYHDFTWLSVAEIMAYPGWDEVYDGAPARESAKWFLDDLSEVVGRTPGVDHRIVFGFDS